MGTRSITIIMSDSDRGEERELCRIYRQFDGYPQGHGKELSVLCDREITNGISGNVMYKGLDKDGMPIRAGKGEYKTSNGMGELAAHVIMALKQDMFVGNIYLEPTQEEVSDWIEYIYIVRGKEGEKPTIECRTKVGPFPNIQTKEGLVFKGTVQEWLEKESFENEDDS
jgi:hypothetical protein